MPTPIVKFDDFYLKREDFNQTGSVKDRSLELQIQNVLKQGCTQAVISSTGNAAISAAYFCQKYHIDLTVYVSDKINQAKLALIRPAQIIKSKTPISDAFKYSKETQAAFLRQSTDPVALQGYGQIALEILKDLPQVSSIFFPVGSGTTLLGVSQNLPPQVKVYAVQPASHPSIVKYFDKQIKPEVDTLTDALSVKLLPLKDKVVDIIKKHQGGGIAVTNDDLLKTIKQLDKRNIKSSPESALAFAGLLNASRKGLPIGDFPLVIFTGANRNE